MVPGVDKISNASVTNISNVQKLICINWEQPLVAVIDRHCFELVDHFPLWKILFDGVRNSELSAIPQLSVKNLKG